MKWHLLIFNVKKGWIHIITYTWENQQVPKNLTVTALVDLMWEKIEPRFGPSEEEEEKEEKEEEEEDQEEENEVVEQLENEDRMEELVENMSTFSLEMAAEANREQFDKAEDYHD